MTKQEALQRAEAARHAAKVISARAALYATTFGGTDKLTQDAMRDADVALEVAGCWERFSNLHPKTRAAALRNCKVPAFWFTPY